MVDLLVNSQCTLGESPLWHPQELALYWLDIAEQLVYRWSAMTNHVSSTPTGAVIGGMTLQSDGSLLLLGARGALYSLRRGTVRQVVPPSWHLRGFRYNDAIADPLGCVFSGVMAVPEPPRSRLDLLRRARIRLERMGMARSPAQKAGTLYRLEAGGSRRPVVRALGRPNGMGFSPDLKTFYCTDSRAKVIHAFDFDRSTGALRGQRLFVDGRAEAGSPDGLTVDASGGVWSAQWNGGCVVRYRPDGSEERRVEFPARRVTSVVFGGEDLRSAFVTTAGGDDRQRHGSGAGAVFRFEPGVVGLPPYRSQVRVPGETRP